MLIELIRIGEFIVTCLIIVSILYISYRAWARHERIAIRKRAELEEKRARTIYGPHGHAATLKRRNKYE